MNLRNLVLGGLTLVSSGCSVALDGASYLSENPDGSRVLQTLASGARVIEKNEMARKSGEDGLNNIANAITDNKGVYTGQNGLEGNPLLWNLEDVDSNGKYVVFSKRLGKDWESNIREIFLMRRDGSELKRLTYDQIGDSHPRLVGDRIIWLSTSFKPVGRVGVTAVDHWIKTYNIKSGSIEGIRDLNIRGYIPEIERALQEEINRLTIK